MPLRVLVAGHVTLDRYGDEWLPGGSAWYAGHAWRALGATVRLFTAAGPDFPAEALAGLEASVTPAAATTRFTNEHHPGGRRTQRVEARAAALSPASLPGGWSDCDVLHLAPVLGEVDLEAFTRAVRARFVGIGVQGWVRDLEPDGTVVQPAWAPDAALLRARVHAACVGEDDLRGQEHLVRLLTRAVPVVALTHGDRGCEVVQDGSTTRVGVYDTVATDPVGAGDVFSAGFFLGLARGDTPQMAARLGAAAASVVVEARGGAALRRVGEAFARCSGVP
jgi:sugar/nucleoside kinase (ribokinase family)